VTVTLTGFKANEAASLRWYINAYTYEELASGASDAYGTATITFDVPADATPGAHAIRGLGVVGYPSASADFTVT
jgi:hypothetical protein